MALTPGSRLGPYEIVAPIGAGGMGEVYRARDPRLSRDVAVKVLPESASKDRERLERFEREARAVAALSHPNVLAIFDIGLGETPFLVTELLEGETLRALLGRGPVTPQRSIDFARQIVAGLGAAHARGIVHRDLKPENVFLTSGGVLKILDFGLATDATDADGPGDSEPAITRLHTLPGVVMGTLGYMAPEQLRGIDTDQRVDIFASGAILFELLTGERAFRGDSPADTITALLASPVDALVFPASTPPALAAVVRRCLEKQASQRFQTARELAEALASISDPGQAPSVSIGRSPASVAVLPFVNLSAEVENQYFSDGLADDLITALARFSGLRVASRTSSFRFRDGEVDARQIGRLLGVGAILEGSVRRAGDRLRISALLSNTDDGYQMWTERYDRQMADVFDVQDEIVQSIVSAIAPALLGEARTAVRRPTENLQAYDLYLKGRYFWNQRSPAVVGTAIRHFEEAIALDPQYALAYAGLADCYSILRVYGWTPPEHSQPRALNAVTRALALDPELAEAHFSRALYVFHFERHWRSARRHFVDALALSPGMAVFEAYFGLFLAAEYDYDEARRRLNRALELDPHSSLIHFLGASIACVMGDAPAAAQRAARAIELQPDSLGARWPETVAHLIANRLDEAVTVGERVVARTRAPIYLGVLAMVYARAGRIADALLLARELDERENRGEYIVPAARLSLQLGLDDRNGIRAALAECVDGGAAPFSIAATHRWLLDTYRGDAEIDRLLDRLHDGARRGEAASRQAGAH